MHENLTDILEIQELDIQMIQLMRLKHERQEELKKIKSSQEALQKKLSLKEEEVIELKKNIRLAEGEVTEVGVRFKKLEAQQSSVKKVDEFNALSQEMSQLERERTAKEQRLSDLYDHLAGEEEVVEAMKSQLAASLESNKEHENEVLQNIKDINEEGKAIKAERDVLVKKANPETFKIYERLLKNKKDRVVVPIENRCCSGCHILLTAQDENLVRKGERLIFCEHCSRIHYWPESEALEGSVAAPKQRRRRSVKT